VLHDCLAGSERAGNGRDAALGDREQRVDDALPVMSGIFGESFSLYGRPLCGQAISASG
jgi:hypothetical protein